MKKRIALFVAFAMVFATMASFGGFGVNEAQAAKKKSYYPVTITNYDYSGKAVKATYKKAPKRVLAIYQSPIETMLALGLSKRVIGAVQLDDPVKDQWKKDFKKIKYFENRPSKEEVIAMHPDMILSWNSLFSDKAYGDVYDWNKKGVSTYMWQNSGVKKPNALKYEYQDILNIGKIFNVEKKAKAIVNRMDSALKKAKASVKGKKKVRAVILEVEKPGQYRIYGLDSIGGEIAAKAGAKLVASKNDTIGKEKLIKLNPDVIFSVYYGQEIERAEAVNSIVKDDSLKTVKAIKNHRVHPIVLSEVYASGVRTYDGIKTIIKGLYPKKK